MRKFYVIAISAFLLPFQAWPHFFILLSTSDAQAETISPLRNQYRQSKGDDIK